MASPTLIGGAQGQVPAELEWLFRPQFSSDDWREAVALYSPRQLGLGRKRSHATLTGLVPFDRLQDACLYFLGFSWVDENNFLRREVPATHPDFPNLFATEIMEAVGVKFLAKAAKPHKWSLPYATYTLCKLTVAYTQPPYEVLSDADLVMASPTGYRGQEMRRWFNWNPKASVDFLEMPGGCLVFNDSRGAPYDGKPAGTGLRALYRTQQVTRKATWWNVPIEFVTDTFGFMTKLDGALGKISSTNFFGQPGHCWLLDDVDTVGSEVYADPIASVAYEGFTRRVDVVFTFKFFDPPNADSGSTERGWRLQPNQPEGKYLPVVFNTDHGKTFPDEVDFTKLFTHWSDGF